MLGKELLEVLEVQLIVIAVLSVFWKGDEVLSEQARRDLGGWLSQLQPPTTDNPIGPPILKVFEGIYGPRHFSLKCVFRSALISTSLFVWVNGIAAVVLDEGEYATIVILEEGDPPVAEPAIIPGPIPEDSLEDGTVTEIRPTFSFLDVTIAVLTGELIVMTLLFNPLSDYCSLLVSRIFLNRLARPGSSLPTIMCLDLVLSTVVFVTLLAGVITAYGFAHEDFGVDSLWAVTEEVLRIFGDMVPPSGYTFDLTNSVFLGLFLTSALSSAWLWAAAIGAATIRALSRSGRTLDFMKHVLDIREKPIRSTGAVSFVLVTITFLALRLLEAAI